MKHHCIIMWKLFDNHYDLKDVILSHWLSCISTISNWFLTKKSLILLSTGISNLILNNYLSGYLNPHKPGQSETKTTESIEILLQYLDIDILWKHLALYCVNERQISYSIYNYELLQMSPVMTLCRLYSIIYIKLKSFTVYSVLHFKVLQNCTEG